MSAEPAAAFVGVAVGAYDDAAFPPLPSATAGLRALEARLRALGCATHVVADPTEAAARAHVAERLAPGALGAGDGLLVLWSGHGVRVRDGVVRLVARDSASGGPAWLTADALAEAAAASGARQILLVLDTCFSGDAAPGAVEALRELLGSLATGHRHTCVGVLTSTLPLQRARDGAFGAVLERVLCNGPRDALLRRMWTPHDSHVRLEDLAHAVLAEWAGSDYEPLFERTGGLALPVFPNPRYDPERPDAVVEELEAAPADGVPAAAREFSGRAAPLAEIVGWLRAGEPGVFALTGPPGSGTSAVVDRLVALSQPRSRAALLARGPLAHADPGEHALDVCVRARGLTPERFLDVLADALVATGAVAPDGPGWPSADALSAALAAAPGVPAVAVDGLDEAGPEARAIAADAIRPLAAHARVLVATRDAHDGRLLAALAPAARLDLGDPALAGQTADDVRAYVGARLAGVAPERMDPAAVGRALADAAEPAGEGGFLLARVVTAQLRETPVDTRADGWQEALASAVGPAFERDLAALEPHPATSAADPPRAARELLTALAWSYGAGMPVDVWAAAASALSPSGAAYGGADVLWLLSAAGRYVVEAGERGQAVYRLAHERLAEHLLPSRRLDHVQEPAARLAAALARHYGEQLDAGATPQGSAYLWHCLWRHAADGGLPGVAALRPLAERDPEAFALDLALALAEAGAASERVGRSAEAATALEEAVALLRPEAAPRYRRTLAYALHNLAVARAAAGDVDGALRAAGEASTRFERLLAEAGGVARAAADSAGRAGTSGGAGTGVRAAPTLAERDAAQALVTLANAYGAAGRSQDAVEPAAEAVDRLRGLAAADPALQPSLAAAEASLGAHCAAAGRPGEALASAERAVARYRAHAGSERPGLAAALALAAERLHEAGRDAEAAAHADEAVELLRPLAADNPAHRPRLALTLRDLAGWHSAAGRHEAALAAAREAAGLCARPRSGPPAEPVAALTRRAETLAQLAHVCDAAGERAEAVQAAEAAVAAREAEAAARPGAELVLAAALSNLGMRYSRAGRHEDAVAAVERAVPRFAAVAAERPQRVVELAQALHNLAVHARAAGQPDRLGSALDHALAALPDADARARLTALLSA